MKGLKYRVWDGREMRLPDYGTFVLTQGGGIMDVGQRFETVVGGPYYPLTPCPSLLPLFYTGLNDAEGNEICEGDVIERLADYDGQPFAGARGVVRRGAFGFVVDEIGDSGWAF